MIVTTTQQQTIQDQPTDWSQELSFAQFDPSLGTLDSLGVTLSGDIVGSVAVESLEAAPSNVGVSLDGVVGIASPTVALANSVSPSAYASAHLGAYDGITNYSGSSGTILAGLAGSSTETTAFQVGGSVDLGSVIGTGSIPVAVSAASSLHLTGPANLQVLSQASAGAGVTLTYGYTPPENTVGSAGAGAGVYDYYGSVTTIAILPIWTTYAQLTTAPQTFSFVDSTTGWTNAVTAQQFNPSLGVLQAVNITLTADLAASVAAENEDSGAAQVSTTQSATVTLDLPDSGTAASVVPSVSDLMNLGGYDGTVDFAGASGRVDQGLTATASQADSLTSDLTPFTGSGTVALPISTVGTSTLDGPGNLLARLLAQAGATVTISYSYVPWSELSSPGSLVFAGTDTWTNPAGGDWATGGNWSSAPQAAGTSDDVVITQAGTYTITVSSAQTVDAVVLDAPGAVLLLDAPLTVANGFTLEAGTLEFNGGTLSVGSYEQDGGLALGGSVDIVASGSVALNGGTIDGTDVSLTAGSSLTVGTGAGILSGSALVSGGTVAPPGSIVATVAPTGFSLDGATGLIETDAGSGSGSVVTAVITPAPVAWTNTEGGNWSVGTNWSSRPNPPGAGADVEINQPGSYTVTIDVPVSLNSIELDDPGATLLDNMSGVTPVGTIDLVAGTLSLNSATLSGTTIQANGGTVTAYQGVLSNVYVVGTLNVGPYANLFVNSGLTATSADGVSPGVINIIGPNAGLTFSDSETLDNIVVVNPALFGWEIEPSGPTLTLGTHATLDVTSSGIVALHSLVSNGTIEIGSGASLSITDYSPHGFSNQGTIALAANAELVLNGQFSVGDLGNIGNAGGFISLDGTLDNNGGTLLIAPGSPFGDLNLDPFGTVAGGTVVAQGGTVGLNFGALANLTWRGPLDLSGDTVTLQNVSVLAANGAQGSATLNNTLLEVTGGGTLDAVTLNASGSSDTIQAGTVTPVSAGLTFGPAATLNAIAGGGSITLLGAPVTNQGRIIVAGTNEVVTPTGSSFVNTGLVQVSSGGVFQAGLAGAYVRTPLTTANLQPESFINAGQFVVGSNGTLRIGPYETVFVNTGTIVLTDATSTLELDGTASASALGTLTGAGGQLVVAGLLDNTGNTLIVSAGGSIGILQLGTGGFAFPSGVILGGTINAPTGTVLFDSATLNNVVWKGPLTVSGGLNSNFLQVQNGLHIVPAGDGPGLVTLNGTSISEINFLDTETLSNLAITAAAERSFITDSGTLSFDPTTTLTVAAGSGELVALGGGSSFSNAGLIYDTVGTGSTITVSGTSFVNSGTIAISGAGNALFVATTTFGNAGQVAISNGATLYLDAPPPTGGSLPTAESFANNGTISLDASSTLIVGGTVTDSALASIHTAGGLVELAGELLNTGQTLTLATGTQLGNLQIGGAGPGTIEGGTVIDQSGVLTWPGAMLDNVTWQGPLNLTGINEALTIAGGTTLLPLSGNGPAVVNVTGSGSSLTDNTASLANARVNLGAVGGSVSFGAPVPISPIVILPAGTVAPALTLAASTTLTAATVGAGNINIGGNIVNQGVIDDTQGALALGAFTPPPLSLSITSFDGSGVVTIVTILSPPPLPTTFDNQGTIVAAAGSGSNVTVGDQTIFNNEGLIQVANSDDLIIETWFFSNTGTLSVAAGSTIELSGSVDNIGTIAFAGTGGVLKLDYPAGVTGTLVNWALGDEILLPAGTGYSVAVNAGTLDVMQNSALLAAFNVGTGYSASAFSLSAAGGAVVIGPQVVGWSNASGGDWGSPTNWSSNPSEPGAATNVAIALAGNYNVSVNDSRAVNSLLLNGAGAALAINGTLSIGDTAAFDAGSVALNGTLAATDVAAIVANAVTLATNIGFGAAVIDPMLDNTGLVQVNHGTLSLNGGGSSNAFGLQAAANAVLQFGTSGGSIESTFSLTGGLYQGLDTVISGSTLDASAASSVIFGTLQLAASGELLLGSNPAQTNAGFTQGPSSLGGATGSPVLSGSSVFTVFGGANLSAGAETGTGTTRLYGLGVIGGNAGFQISGGRTLENDGWLNWSSGNITVGDTVYQPYPATTGGTFNNVAGAIFYITASGARIANGIGGMVNNAGIIAVYAGSSGVAIGDPVNNTGYIQVQSGVLSLNDGGSSDAGGFYVAPGAELEFGLANRAAGQPSGPSSFTLTGGNFTASTVLINGTTLDASAVSAMSVASLRLDAAGALLLGAGNAQTTGAFLQGPTTDANATGLPFLSGSGTFTVFGGASLTNGVESGSGLTRLFGVSSIGGTPAFELDGGRTVENDGWLNWSSGTITLGAGDPTAPTQAGTLTNAAGATFFITASDDRIGNAAGGVLNNAGVMAVYAGGGEVDIDAAANNTGYIQAQSGTLSFNGGGTSDAGHLIVGSGAVLQFGTAASGVGGTFDLNGGVYAAGKTQITSGTVDLSAASGASFGSSLAISGGGVLRLGGLYTGVDTFGLGTDGSGGSLSGTGNFTVGSFAELGSGLLTGSGVMVLNGFASIAGPLQLDGGRTLQNDGALTWSSGSITLGGGDPGAASQAGYLTNVAGATFQIETGGSIASPGSGAVFNAGSMVMLAGGSTMSVQALMDNTGTVAVQSGTLSFAQSAIGAGTFDVEGSAKLDFASVVDSNARIAFIGGGGTLAIDSGGFGATVSGFAAGDVLDLTAVQFALAPVLGFNGGTLSVSDGTHSVAFGLTGTFAQSGFHLADNRHGGTAITY